MIVPLVDNNLLHFDRLEAYQSASELLESLELTKKERIEKRIWDKLGNNREPRRSKRNAIFDKTAEKLLELLEKTDFDPQNFLFNLEILQNKVTDIANATVKEMKNLRDGLTNQAILGEFSFMFKMSASLMSDSHHSCRGFNHKLP